MNALCFGALGIIRFFFWSKIYRAFMHKVNAAISSIRSSRKLY